MPQGYSPDPETVPKGELTESVLLHADCASPMPVKATAGAPNLPKARYIENMIATRKSTTMIFRMRHQESHRLKDSEIRFASFKTSSVLIFRPHHHMQPKNRFAITTQDYMGHTWILGTTGGGKTNTLLYILNELLDTESQKIFPTAVVLIDPHGYASMELARMVRPLGKVIILDPTYVSFGINPLRLPKEFGNRNEIVKDRVSFLSSILTDVLNTEQANAPRLMWVFKGALYYLYSFGDNPTFKDLYLLLGEMHTEGRSEREKLRGRLKNRGVSDEIVQKTIESIAELDPNAFSPIMNRISNFVMPGKSMTSRTFCCRESTIDWSEIRKPGTVTIFRLSRALIADEDFRKLTMSIVIMNLFAEVQKQAREFERSGRPTSEMTNIVLAMDEFQWIGKLSVISTILSEARKFKLFLYMAHQNLGQLDKELLNTLSGNSGMIISHALGPDDSRYIAKLLDPTRADQITKEIAGLAGHDSRLRKNPIYSREVRSLSTNFPRADEAFPFAYSEDQIKQYMRGIMETRFGGAHEAEDVIYRIGEDKVQKGLEHWSPIRWFMMLLPYVDPIGFSQLEDKRLCAKLYRENGWSRTAVHNAIEDMVRLGFFVSKFDNYPYAFSGTDDNAVSIGMKVRPNNKDDLERTSTAIYTPTDSQKNWFISFFQLSSSRSGGAIHVAVVKKLVQEYWRQGAFCMVDFGKEDREAGDIRVIYPSKIEFTEKNTDVKTLVWSPYVWNYDSSFNVEVEENPSKNPDHVFHNFLKDHGNNPLRFVVTSKENEDAVRRILTDQHGIEPAKYTVECVPFKSLNSDSPDQKRELDEQEQKPETKRREEPSRKVASTLSSVFQPPTLESYPTSPVTQPSVVAGGTSVSTSVDGDKSENDSLSKSSVVQENTESKGLPTPTENKVRETVVRNDARMSKEKKKLETMKLLLFHLHEEGYPGRDKLAKAIGVSVKTVDRYLDELEKRGLIEKTGRTSFTVSEFAAKTIEESRDNESSQVDST